MRNKIEFLPTHTFIEKLDCNPLPSSSCIPEWYKNSPILLSSEISKPRVKCCPFTGKVSTNTTYKNCTPFVDALSTGYIFRLPVDVQFRYTDKGFIEFSSRVMPSTMSNEDILTFEIVTTHDKSQHPGLPNLNFNNNINPLVFKWMPNFSIKTPKGYSTFYTQPINRYDLPFLIYSGVVDTDSYDMIPVQFPFQITYSFKHEDDILIIPKDTPICQVFPFRREDWKHSIGKFNSNMLRKASLTYFSKIVNAYKSRYWKKKSYI